MKLGIAIPALNEEDNSSVTHMEVTVVNDGSTDRAVERASSSAL